MATNAALTLLAATLPVAFAQAPSGNSSSSHGSSGGHSDEPYVPTAADIENWQICKYTAWTWAAIVAALLIFRWTRYLLHHVRRLANLNHLDTP